jgi:hypothetical protein
MSKNIEDVEKTTIFPIGTDYFGLTKYFDLCLYLIKGSTCMLDGLAVARLRKLSKQKTVNGWVTKYLF